jgi:hypothetical protein
MNLYTSELHAKRVEVPSLARRVLKVTCAEMAQAVFRRRRRLFPGVWKSTAVLQRAKEQI